MDLVMDRKQARRVMGQCKMTSMSVSVLQFIVVVVVVGNKPSQKNIVYSFAKPKHKGHWNKTVKKKDDFFIWHAVLSLLCFFSARSFWSIFHRAKWKKKKKNSNNNNWTITILLLFICYCSCPIPFRRCSSVALNIISLRLCLFLLVWLFLLLLHLLHTTKKKQQQFEIQEEEVENG